MIYPHELTVLDFKTTISTYAGVPPKNRTGSKRKQGYKYELCDLPTHLPEIVSDRKRCIYCYKEGFDRKHALDALNVFFSHAW